jgi:hypothetical protein
VGEHNPENQRSVPKPSMLGPLGEELFEGDWEGTGVMMEEVKDTGASSKVEALAET